LTHFPSTPLFPYNPNPLITREIAGEGRWTVQEAIDHDVPAPIITLSLLTRFRSRQDDSYGAKVLAALRNEFGGHPVKTE
jgi:6-phosphogluconate dehydrogenase